MHWNIKGRMAKVFIRRQRKHKKEEKEEEKETKRKKDRSKNLTIVACTAS